MNQQHVIHPIPPVWDEQSKILILGSFPSVKSRENNFFYGHPQNRFWKVLAHLFLEEVPLSIEEKKNFLLKHQIAVWDVIHSCDITGSSDSSIHNVVPNDLSMLLKKSQIKVIFVNGKTAYKLYMKYLYSVYSIQPLYLPSTSPANARCHFEQLVLEWIQILSYLL